MHSRLVVIEQDDGGKPVARLNREGAEDFATLTLPQIEAIEGALHAVMLNLSAHIGGIDFKEESQGVWQKIAERDGVKLARKRLRKAWDMTQDLVRQPE